MILALFNLYNFLTTIIFIFFVLKVAKSQGVSLQPFFIILVYFSVQMTNFYDCNIHLFCILNNYRNLIANFHDFFRVLDLLPDSQTFF